MSRAKISADMASLWLRPHMKARRYRAGTTLFSKGDVADRLYMLAVGQLEVVGIGIILPLIKIISDPELLLRNPYIEPFLRARGLTHPQTIILVASLGTLCLFIFKGAYLALSLRISYGFIYHKMLSLSRQLLNAYLHTSYLFHLQHNTAQLIRNTIAESEQVAGILKFCIVLPTEFLVILGLVVVLFVAHPPAALGGTLLPSRCPSSCRAIGSTARGRGSSQAR